MRKKFFVEIAGRLKRGDFQWLLRRARHGLSIPSEALTKKCVSGPILASVAVTYRCNERCLYCELPSRAGPPGDEDTASMKDLLSQLARLGVSTVSFTGGEPLLREDMAELISYASGFKVSTNLTTNGIKLTPGLSESLIAAGLDSLNISLDSADPEYVNTVRSSPKAFEGAVTAIETMAAAKKKQSSSRPNLSVSTVLTSRNCEDVTGLIRFIKEKGADAIYFNVMEVDFNLYRENRSRNYLDDREKLGAALALIRELRLKDAFIDNSPRYLARLGQYVSGPFPDVSCFAGYHSMVIDYRGAVFPCFYYFQNNRALATLARGEGLREFWHGREYERVRRELLSCRECFFGCQMELNELYQMTLLR
ncbi:MAG: radical SAM protein [Candidatus Eremiobacteraeota bacterium]|nr:radical SAM protein [Candidatus Eremiobacteraeota bacterium]